MRKGKTTIIDDCRTTNILGDLWSLFVLPPFLLMGIASWWSLLAEPFTWEALVGAIFGPGVIIGTIVFWVLSYRKSERTFLNDDSIATYDRFGTNISFVDLTEPVYYQDVSTVRYPFTLISNHPFYVEDYWEAAKVDDAVLIDRSPKDLSKKYDITLWTNIG